MKDSGISVQIPVWPLMSCLPLERSVDFSDFPFLSLLGNWDKIPVSQDDVTCCLPIAKETPSAEQGPPGREGADASADSAAVTALGLLHPVPPRSSESSILSPSVLLNN